VLDNKHFETDRNKMGFLQLNAVENI